MKFDLKIEGNLNKLVINKITNNSNLEAHITNRVKHAMVAEFGSGIYSQEPGGRRSVIYPRSSKMLIIPVIQKYLGKLDSKVKEEAKNNAKQFPEIMNKLRVKFRNVYGFIFRRSVKGMKPIRMVRNSVKPTEKILRQYYSDMFNKKGFSITRQELANFINIGAAYWLAEIVKRTPVLTSNLKTGWTISKLAK